MEVGWEFVGAFIGEGLLGARKKTQAVESRRWRSPLFSVLAFSLYRTYGVRPLVFK
jgi:hypothetical protein